MMQKVRINESQLKKIVKESVKRMLNEGESNIRFNWNITVSPQDAQKMYNLQNKLESAKWVLDFECDEQSVETQTLSINESTKWGDDEYDQQWKRELRMFMSGLRSGDYFVDSNDTVYVQIWKRQSSEGNERYVYFRKGDTRLHDDSFSAQDSPRLSTRTLNTINNTLGWNDNYDDEY